MSQSSPPWSRLTRSLPYGSSLVLDGSKTFLSKLRINRAPSITDVHWQRMKRSRHSRADSQSSGSTGSSLRSFRLSDTLKRMRPASRQSESIEYGFHPFYFPPPRDDCDPTRIDLERLHSSLSLDITLNIPFLSHTYSPTKVSAATIFETAVHSFIDHCEGMPRDVWNDVEGSGGWESDSDDESDDEDRSFPYMDRDEDKTITFSSSTLQFPISATSSFISIHQLGSSQYLPTLEQESTYDLPRTSPPTSPLPHLPFNQRLPFASNTHGRTLSTSYDVLLASTGLRRRLSASW